MRPRNSVGGEFCCADNKFVRSVRTFVSPHSNKNFLRFNRMCFVKTRYTFHAGPARFDTQFQQNNSVSTEFLRCSNSKSFSQLKNSFLYIQTRILFDSTYNESLNTKGTLYRLRGSSRIRLITELWLGLLFSRFPLNLSYPTEWIGVFSADMSPARV